MVYFPLLRLTSSGYGDEQRDVAVQVRHAAIESRQLPVAASRELGKEGIGHLSVTNYTPYFDPSERGSVGSEFVAVRSLDSLSAPRIEQDFVV